MAKIYTENITISFSTIMKDNDKEPATMLSEYQLTTLLESIEAIVDDKSVIVELKGE
jgi:hypothetical protein